MMIFLCDALPIFLRGGAPKLLHPGYPSGLDHGIKFVPAFKGKGRSWVKIIFNRE